LKAIKVHVQLYWAFFDSGSAIVFGWPMQWAVLTNPGSSLPGRGPGFFRTPGRDRAEGEGEMKGWKWAGDLRVQVCIIAALIFIIWIVLQQQYY
jgi:hypothetical protein